MDIAGDRTEIPELAGQQRPDLVLLNDDDLSYAKIRLDEHSMRTMVGHIGAFTDSLPAALCWAAAWDMCRDAELPARSYVTQVVEGAGSVADISVLQTLLRQAGAAARRYTDPAWREAACGPWRPGCAAWPSRPRRARTGSSPSCSRSPGWRPTPGDLALLAGLLDGSATLDGLEVDTELRWRLLHRLVARGVAGPAEIDAELARDATDAGERRAATCRAAIGDPAAKEAAWAAITSGSLPNAVFRATLAGFADADRPDLLEPYAARFFDVVGTVWATWSSDMAQWFASNAFPLTQLSEHTLRLADEYLAQADPPAPLRRLIIEGKDSVQRALRCQERRPPGG